MKITLVNTDIVFEDKVVEVNFDSSLGFSLENVVPQENLERLYYCLQKHLGKNKVFQISYETVNEWNVTHTVFDGKLFNSKKEAEEYAVPLYGNRFEIIEINLQISLLKRFNYRERRVGGKFIPPIEILENSMDYEILRTRWDWKEEFETIKISYKYINREIIKFNTDNHQVCIVEICGRIYYIEFSDGYLHIGKNIFKGVGNIDTDYPTL